MSRILKRPMFRVGGPVMDGIMSGIQDRKPMAGGGQIGGGTIYGKPMGNRTGYAEPVSKGGAGNFMSNFMRDKFGRPTQVGGGFGGAKGFFRPTTATPTPRFYPPVPIENVPKGPNFELRGGSYKPPGSALAVIKEPIKPTPKFSEKYLLEIAKKYGKKGITGLLTNFPKLGSAGLAYGAYELEQGLSRLAAPETMDLKKRYAEQEGLSGIGKFVEENLNPLYTKKLLDFAEQEKKSEETPIVSSKKKPLEVIPEKGLEDIYNENKGIIEKILDTGDDNTKSQMYLKLAEFGSNLSAQPGGNLLGAVGKAAKDPIKGVSKILSDRRKEKLAINKLALQKTFEDMKPSEQVKAMKEYQKLLGFGTGPEGFKKTVDYMSKGKTSAAQIAKDNEFHRGEAKKMDVNPNGYLNSIRKFEADPKLKALIGNFNKQIPKDKDDRVVGEYYVTKNGTFIRINSKKQIIKSNEPEFFGDIKKKTK